MHVHKRPTLSCWIPVPEFYAFVPRILVATEIQVSRVYYSYSYIIAFDEQVAGNSTVNVDPTSTVEATVRLPPINSQ